MADHCCAERRYVEWHYAECHFYAECRYAECRYAECRGANKIFGSLECYIWLICLEWLHL
jgi:hypothetical protein